MAGVDVFLDFGLPNAVDDARMDLFISDDDISPVDDRRDRAQVDLKAGAVDESGLLADEFRQPILELQVHFQRAVEEPGSRAARPILTARLGGRFLEPRGNSPAE